MEYSLNSKKPSYFKEILKNGYFIYALALAAIITTVCIFAIDFGYLSAIRESSYLKNFLIVAAAIFSIAVLMYFIFRVKTKCVSFADCFANALILACLAVAAYAFFFAKKNYPVFYIIVGGIFVISLCFCIVFAVRREKRNEKREIIFTSNTLVGYYTNVFRKYRFLGIISISILTTCVFYMLFNDGFAGITVEVIGEAPLMRYLIIASLTLFGAWLAIDASRQRVSVIDAFLLSNIAVIPITFALIYFSDDLNSSKSIFWAIYLGIIIIVFFVRMLSFDVTVNYSEKDKSSKTYLSAFIKKINPLLVLSTVAIIITVGVFCYLSQIYRNSIIIENGKLVNVALETWPLTAMLFACDGITLFGFLSGIFAVRDKKIGIADFFVWQNLILGIAAIIGIYWIENVIYAVAACVWTFINLVLLGIRIRTVRKNIR